MPTTTGVVRAFFSLSYFSIFYFISSLPPAFSRIIVNTTRCKREESSGGLKSGHYCTRAYHIIHQQALWLGAVVQQVAFRIQEIVECAQSPATADVPFSMGGEEGREHPWMTLAAFKFEVSVLPAITIPGHT